MKEKEKIKFLSDPFYVKNCLLIRKYVTIS